MPALFELESAYKHGAPRSEVSRRARASIARVSSAVRRRFTSCANLTAKLGGAKIYLKREDLCHTGAHKVNNTLGQALLAVRMNKSRITAETGAGQHGVATATMAALFRRECEVFMGSVDVERQSLNVFRMKLLGAKVTAGRARQQEPEGRDERGAARLDRDRAQHLLPDRHRPRDRIRTR